MLATTKIPICVFPLYYSYVCGISSRDYPVFNAMLEIYLKEGYDVSPQGRIYRWNYG